MEDCVLDRAPVCAPVCAPVRAAERRHMVRVVGCDAREVLSALSEALGRDVMEVRSLNLRTIGRQVEANLHLAGLEEEDARSFGDRLAVRPGVQSVGVEHHWGRP